MNRYPELQRQQDDDDQRVYARVAGLRPGATVEVSGLVERKIGPRIRGRVLTSAVSELGGDKVLISSREYGRAWFHTQGHAFSVDREVC